MTIDVAAIARVLAFVLSLPERAVRSLAAVVGGLSLLLSEVIFPRGMKGSVLYKILIGDTQRFLVERVAQIKREGEAMVGVPADFVQRKMVGGALETAGLLAMHFSPLWVFALAADAAGGSRVFFERLVEHLRRNGVLPADEPANDLADVLYLMGEASQKSVMAIDTPPLSRKDFEQLANELKLTYGLMFARSLNLLPDFEGLWQRTMAVAREQKVRPEEVWGLLTIQAAGLGSKGIGAIQAVGATGSELVGELVLASYGQTLLQISQEGVDGYIRNHMRPFWQAAGEHFRPGHRTVTETLLGKGYDHPAETGSDETQDDV